MLAWGFVFIVLTNLSGVINPQIVSKAIDYLKDEIRIQQLLIYAGSVIAVTFVQGIFRYFTRKTVIVVSRLIENDLRNDLFAQLQRLPNDFYQHNSTGDIMARLTNDLNSVRSVLGPGLMYTVNTLTSFFFVIIMMLIISPLLTIIAMIPVPLMVIVVNKFNRQINRRYSALQAQFSRISTKVQENLAGIRIVKSYVLEKNELDDFNRLNKEYIYKNMHYVKIHAAFRPSMMLIVGLGVALILLFGGRMIINNSITLGQFVAFNLYLAMLVWPSIALGWVMDIFYQCVASMNRLDHILKADGPVLTEEQKLPQQAIRGRIEFSNLTFTYPGREEPVLKDITLLVPAGRIIALVGRTGSGKTTLMQLITRIYDPPPGSIFIDGLDIRHHSVRELRNYIGYIPQDTFLFSESIRNNIAFGIPEASMDQIEQAAKMAHLHDSIIEFPDGYDTLLGERGINLSGGQKQRLAIARAILKEPRILLLDDALSAVDTLTEEAILNNLRVVMQNRTCFWISHRISSIKNADHIIVLEEGQIVEQGGHEKLLMSNGIYADLYEKQQLEESIRQLE